MTHAPEGSPGRYSGPVAAGFVSFTEVLAGEHRSYNEWHMLDHMPEQRPIQGIRHGERWVATPDCVAARIAAAAPLDASQYFTLYLLAEPLDATLRDFYRRGRELQDAGRFHEHRVSHLSGPLRVTGAWTSPRVLVSSAAVAFRPNLGVFVLADQHDDVSPDHPAAMAAPALVELDGVAGIWTFASDPGLGSMSHAPGEWRVSVAFLDADPVAVTESSGDRLVAGLASPGIEPAYAGPLRSILPGHWDWFDSGSTV